MSQAVPEGTPGNVPAQGQPITEPPPTWDDLFEGEDPAKVKEALDNSRRWESRAKSNSEAVKRVAELEKQRQATMTEAERAVSEAETRGRTAATTEYGKRLARTEFDAAAGRRNPDFDTASALEFVDLSRFLGDDGEPDPKAIKAAVERLVPEANPGPAGFDGGARSTATTEDFNQTLRRAAGRA